MYAVHTTDGLVLHKRGIGEANTLLFVLTQDLGLLRASARSTRVHVSKLRYGLEPLTLARYSFVKGRHEWRLVQVEAPRNAFTRALPVHTAAAGRVSQLLLRLIQGAEHSPLLYKDVVDGFALLAAAPRGGEVEVVLVLRILSHLGYLPQVPALAPFVDSEFSMELSAKALKERSLLVRTINEALKVSGL